MCGDSHLPPAPESGDLIAIIHPNSRSLSTFRGRLRLSNRVPGATTSSLSLSSSSSSCQSTSPIADQTGLLNVRIHKYGQPLRETSLDGSEDECVSLNPVLHSFLVDTSASSRIVQRLNLGVGGDGIVGRTVSIFDGQSNRVLGEGVIGWS